MAKGKPQRIKRPNKIESNYYKVTMICEDHFNPRLDISDVSSMLKDFCQELFKLHNIEVKLATKKDAVRKQRNPNVRGNSKTNRRTMSIQVETHQR